MCARSTKKFKATSPGSRSIAHGRHLSWIREIVCFCPQLLFLSQRLIHRLEDLSNDIKGWLTPPDPSLNLRKSLKLRVADTGAWFLQSTQYSEWKASDASFLWLYGSAGSGKTILSSGIVEDLLPDCRNDPARALAYFYFDFNESAKQDPLSMVKSLLRQFMDRCARTPQALQSTYASCQNGQREPSYLELDDALKNIVETSPTSYIVLDALDECTARTELFEILEQIHSWGIANLHVLVTSRIEVDIEEALEGIVPKSDRVCLESRLVNQDIRTYIVERLQQDKFLRRWQQDLAIQEEIQSTLVQKAGGMYDVYSQRPCVIDNTDCF